VIIGNVKSVVLLFTEHQAQSLNVPDVDTIMNHRCMEKKSAIVNTVEVENGKRKVKEKVGKVRRILPS